MRKDRPRLVFQAANDLIIAATVRAAGATLITANLRAFSRVPLPRCEDWTVK